MNKANSIRSLSDKIYELGESTSHDLRYLCEIAIKNKEFQTYPGSLKWHHDYEGGLMVHTTEVLDFSLQIANADSADIDKGVLMVAAIWHDYGKIYDYMPTAAPVPEGAKVEGYYEYTSHKYQIHHISRSYHEFMKYATQFDLTHEFLEKVGHCILSHHGRPEWGSPVKPQTPEAHTLHYADMLSVHAAKTV